MPKHIYCLIAISKFLECLCNILVLLEANIFVVHTLKGKVKHLMEFESDILKFENKRLWNPRKPVHCQVRGALFFLLFYDHQNYVLMDKSMSVRGSNLVCIFENVIILLLCKAKICSLRKIIMILGFNGLV